MLVWGFFPMSSVNIFSALKTLLHKGVLFVSLAPADTSCAATFLIKVFDVVAMG